VRPEAGQRFGHFHVYSVLGRGGMGVVFSAFNIREERVVALKLLPAEQAGEPAARERFRRESQLARSLDSPHAIPVLDAGEHEGELWLEMPLLPGEDLSALVARQRTLQAPTALGIAGQVGHALDAAHRIGLVHRDVKPANIRLVEIVPGVESRAYLGDFGLTRSASVTDAGLTRVNEVVGTAQYMSPEQVLRQPLDGRTDIYSLACVVYRCLAGAPPFAGDDVGVVMEAHVGTPVPPLQGRAPGVGPHLERAILAGLAKDRARRPLTADAFVEGCLRAVAADTNGESLAPEVTGGPGPAGGRVRRALRLQRPR
jgi:serine/threonine protein kinase